MNLKSTTTNGFNFRIINSLWNLGGYTWPGLTVITRTEPSKSLSEFQKPQKRLFLPLFRWPVRVKIAATFNIIAILCAVGDARCTLGNHKRTRPRIWSPYPTIRLRLYTAKFVVRASIEKYIHRMKLIDLSCDASTRQWSAPLRTEASWIRFLLFHVSAVSWKPWK